MSSLLEALKQRRSIRKYQNKPVPKELVFKVLESAGFAPSAHNSQPWRFVVIEDSEVKTSLAEQMAQAWAADMEKNGSKIDEAKRIERRERFTKAPVLIIACLAMDGMIAFTDEQRQLTEHDLAVESLAAAIQNILLTAHGLGLGACWYCAPAFCKPTVRKTLHIPETVEPTALVTIGYPAESLSVSSKKTLGEYCYSDCWGKPLH